MEMLQQLKDRYAQYTQAVQTVMDRAKPTDGLFGMGDDPRNDPCHMRFYEDVAQWIQVFAAAGPDKKAIFEAVYWILTTPAAHKKCPEFWFEFAAHGLCGELICRLDPAQCAVLQAFYDENYPRRDRMLVQKEIYKLLKKGAAKE